MYIKACRSNSRFLLNLMIVLFKFKHLLKDLNKYLKITIRYCVSFVVRLGAYEFSINNIKFYSHSGAYQCSTVSALSQGFLINCRENGISTAWDLEKYQVQILKPLHLERELSFMIIIL